MTHFMQCFCDTHVSLVTTYTYLISVYKRCRASWSCYLCYHVKWWMKDTPVSAQHTHTHASHFTRSDVWVNWGPRSQWKHLEKLYHVCKILFYTIKDLEYVHWNRAVLWHLIYQQHSPIMNEEKETWMMLQHVTEEKHVSDVEQIRNTGHFNIHDFILWNPSRRY